MWFEAAHLGLHPFAQFRAKAVCLESGRKSDSRKNPARQAETRGGEFRKACLRNGALAQNVRKQILC